MTLGNVWLGSMQLNQITVTQLMSTNSFVMTTVVLTSASVMDYVAMAIAGATTETMQVCLIPVAGTAYCSTIYNTSTSGKNSVFWQPDRPLFLYPGDQIKVKVSNGDTTGTIYGNVMVLF